TQRLGSLRCFDKIVFLHEGRMIAVGTFDELLKTSAPFQAFCKQTMDDTITQDSNPHHAVTDAISEPSLLPGFEIERTRTGAVEAKTYWRYFQALGGSTKRAKPFLLASLVIAAGAVTTFPLLQNTWLSQWMNDPD